jgi:hypothetical protein
VCTSGHRPARIIEGRAYSCKAVKAVIADRDKYAGTEQNEIVKMEKMARASGHEDSS